MSRKRTFYPLHSLTQRSPSSSSSLELKSLIFSENFPLSSVTFIERKHFLSLTAAREAGVVKENVHGTTLLPSEGPWEGRVGVSPLRSPGNWKEGRRLILEQSCLSLYAKFQPQLIQQEIPLFNLTLGLRFVRKHHGHGSWRCMQVDAAIVAYGRQAVVFCLFSPLFPQLLHLPFYWSSACLHDWGRATNLAAAAIHPTTHLNSILNIINTAKKTVSLQ